MKVLIVKTSSMGDVIHTLPALTDAAKRLGDISFDWVVEESFQEIPAMHPNVANIISVNIRRWRKNIWRYRHEIKAFKRQLKQTHYDCVIDAQGLIKSAWLTRLVDSKRFGLDSKSIKEPLASLAYTNRISVSKGQHAVDRIRQLFAQSLGYSLVNLSLDYGLSRNQVSPSEQIKRPYVVFLHGTTWSSKHWPEIYWKDLIAIASNGGYDIYLPWGNEVEKQRAELLCKAEKKAHVLPRSSITELARLLTSANGVVGVDSGLAHLAAACDTAGVTLYGSTSAVLTGTTGKRITSLQADFTCSPCLKKNCAYHLDSAVEPACYQALNPAYVFHNLQKMMAIA